MKVLKVINNNMVSTRDNRGKEIIVMGCGLGFKAKADQEIDESRIERVYRMDNQSQTEQLISLFGELPLEQIELANDVISYAKTHIDKTFNPTIYLTLTDHIGFAIKRSREGIQTEAPLLYETKRFYPEEYDVGVRATHMLEERLHISLPRSEASSIAIHFINAEMNTKLDETMRIHRIMQNTTNIVRMHLQRELDTESTEYERFIMHLRYFAHRIVTGKVLRDSDGVLYDMIAIAYPNAVRCALRIADYIEQEYNFTVTRDEMSYLAIHIQRNVPA